MERKRGTSTLRLSSVRELPGQLQELYQQGFVLASVHPFIHPCGPESNSPQHQLYRAILIRLNDGAPAKTGCVAQSHRLPLHLPSSPVYETLCPGKYGGGHTCCPGHDAREQLQGSDMQTGVPGAAVSGLKSREHPGLFTKTLQGIDVSELYETSSTA
ncbi:hypothetical protein NQZ68_034418 [Dissostichus eleginoides]|nr:hypothetical protein NQZ68_034418 [Dissostichus eleginoides]